VADVWSGIVKAIRREPDAKLAAVQLSVSEMGQRIEILRSKREAKLSAVDLDMPAIAAIDQEIASLTSSVAIFRERETKLLQKQRERDRARRVDEKKSAVADVEKRLGRRYDLAVKADEALRILETVVPELMDADDAVFRNWSDTLPDARLLKWTSLATIRDLSSRPPTSMTLHAGILQTVAGHGTYRLAEQAEEANRELIAELQKAAIPDNDIDTEAA
jgi:hypothetical protein